MEGMDLAARRPLDHTPGAADPEVQRALSDRRPWLRPPARQVLGLTERVKDQLARCVEFSAERDLAIGRPGHAERVSGGPGGRGGAVVADHRRGSPWVARPSVRDERWSWPASCGLGAMESLTRRSP